MFAPPRAPMTEQELEAWRQRTAEVAAGHRATVEGRDHDQRQPGGFYDTSGAYRTKHAGQRGRF